MNKKYTYYNIMPILQLSMRSQDLDNGAFLNATSELQPAKKTFRLNETYKMKYLKLLHVYHNLSSANLIDGGGSANTIIFVKISFLTSGQSVFFESRHTKNTAGDAIVGSSVETESGLLCLGKTTDDINTIEFRDMYKMLHNDPKNPLIINQPFTIELFKLVDAHNAAIVVADTGLTSANVLAYNLVDSHVIVPVSQTEFRGGLDGIGQFINLIFEYTNDDTK